MIARTEADNAVMKFKLVAVVGVIAALMMNVAMVNATRARAADAITYTLEPWDMDGVFRNRAYADAVAARCVRCAPASRFLTLLTACTMA
jgi:hypothetical protein